MWQTLISAWIAQFFLYKLYIAEAMIQCIEFIARQVARITLVSMLLALATVSAFLFIGDVKGFVPHTVEFSLLTIVSPSISVAVVGYTGLALVSLMMFSADLIRFPPYTMKKAINRLKA
jgi:hypothetical protein